MKQSEINKALYLNSVLTEKTYVAQCLRNLDRTQCARFTTDDAGQYDAFAASVDDSLEQYGSVTVLNERVFYLIRQGVKAALSTRLMELNQELESNGYVEDAESEEDFYVDPNHDSEGYPYDENRMTENLIAAGVFIEDEYDDYDSNYDDNTDDYDCYGEDDDYVIDDSDAYTEEEAKIVYDDDVYDTLDYDEYNEYEAEPKDSYEGYDSDKDFI